MRNGYLLNRGIFKQAAKQLFNFEVHQLKQKSSDVEVHLNPRQIKQLAAKIRLLPEDWQNALLLCYGFGFDTELSSDVLNDSDVSDNILYVKDTLAFRMKVPDISRESLAESCCIVLQSLHKQVKLEQQDNPISTSRKLDKKIQQLARKQSKVKHLSFYIVAKRAAMIFLAILIASIVTVMSVEAFRNKFFDWLFSIFPTHTRVEFSDVSFPSDLHLGDRLNQYAPTYLPEGFVLVDTVETDTRYKLYYANPDNQYIIFEVGLIIDQRHTNANTENNAFEEILINSHAGFYSYDGSSHLLIWSDEQYLLRILCDTTKQDTIKIAESTK